MFPFLLRSFSIFFGVRYLVWVHTVCTVCSLKWVVVSLSLSLFLSHSLYLSSLLVGRVNGVYLVVDSWAPAGLHINNNKHHPDTFPFSCALSGSHFVFLSRLFSLPLFLIFLFLVFAYEQLIITLPIASITKKEHSNEKTCTSAGLLLNFLPALASHIPYLFHFHFPILLSIFTLQFAAYLPQYQRFHNSTLNPFT
jgi:hypothetical protein